MLRLYELPEHQNIRLYIGDTTVIFDHLDGLYSYCWIDGDKSKVVHINACTLFKKHKDGYRYVGDNNV